MPVTNYVFRCNSNAILRPLSGHWRQGRAERGPYRDRASAISWHCTRISGIAMLSQKAAAAKGPIALIREEQTPA